MAILRYHTIGLQGMAVASNIAAALRRNAPRPFNPLALTGPCPK